MPWFSDKNQATAAKLGAAAGAILGAKKGFEIGGLGGSILFAIFGLIGGAFVGGLAGLIFDGEFMAGCSAIGLLLIILFSIIYGISALWGVGL